MHPQAGDRSDGDSQLRSIGDGDSDAPPIDPPRSLLVVSNRQPYRHTYTPSQTDDVPDAPSQTGDDSQQHSERERAIEVEEPTGGLTAGLDPVMCDAGGTWIAWGDGDADREVTGDDDCVSVPPESGAYALRRLWLDDDAVEGYYAGFANRVLWPLCHDQPDLLSHRPDDLEWYRRVNRTFADAVAEHATSRSTIWLQDYHLGFAPSMIREAVSEKTTIAHFWHVPWPERAVFERCPAGEALLRGLLGNDLLGFHVRRFGERFLECAERFLPEASVETVGTDVGTPTVGTVRAGNSRTDVVATPLGIDAAEYDAAARELDGNRWNGFARSYEVPDGTKIGVGVDRLDYSKGIPHRLDAVERFFERYPEWRGSFTFVQKATPSRTSIPAYERLGERVRTRVERINERFGTDESAGDERGWRPIVYTEDVLPRSDICALYRRADVGLVTSTCDGMNLVAQEYVASCVDGNGALLLSTEAGASELLGDAAYSVDPTDTDGVARTLERALSAPASVTRNRLRTLRNRVRDHDMRSWMATQFDLMKDVRNRRRQRVRRERVIPALSNDGAPPGGSNP